MFLRNGKGVENSKLFSTPFWQTKEVICSVCVPLDSLGWEFHIFRGSACSYCVFFYRAPV